MSLLELVLSILSGLLLATTVVYKRRSNMYKKAYKETVVLANQSIAGIKTATDSAKTAMEGYNMMKQKYESLKAEHAIIFDNLKEDPMCLAKAVSAYDDVCDALLSDDETVLSSNGNTSVFVTALGANLVYDSASINHYDTDTKEITISMFDDMQNEQGIFIFDYLNDKYGISLNSNDIRTRFIFTTLHELGHHVDLSNKEQAEIDSYNALYEPVYAMEDGPESWQAYREVPTEAFADKFAVDFMIKHFPELV